MWNSSAEHLSASLLTRRGRQMGVLLAIACMWSTALAAQVSVSGQIGAEARGFPSAPLFPGQDSHMASTYLAPRLHVELTPGHTLDVAPFVRVITDRPGRSAAVYFRTLAWSGSFQNWDAGAGIRTVRWGLGRGYNPVDVVNQKDRSFHPLSESRIGQPMLSLSTDRAWGRVELLAMSGMPTRLHARRDSRLRGAAWVDPSVVQYARGAGGQLDVAGRWSEDLADAQVGVTVFHGTSRDPLYVLTEGAMGSTLVSRYESLRQVGLDARVNRGGWSFKGETVVRRVGRSAPHLLTVVGVDRRFRRDAIEVTIIGEYIHDSRGEGAPSIVEDDFYLEGRLRTRSAKPLEVATRLLVDRTSGSTIWTLSIERPVTRGWVLSLGTWQFFGTDLRSLNQDGYVSTALRRSF